jgi:hypothetical protein
MGLLESFWIDVRLGNLSRKERAAFFELIFKSRTPSSKKRRLRSGRRRRKPLIHRRETRRGEGASPEDED